MLSCVSKSKLLVFDRDFVVKRTYRRIYVCKMLLFSKQLLSAEYSLARYTKQCFPYRLQFTLASLDLTWHLWLRRSNSFVGVFVLVQAYYYLYTIQQGCQANPLECKCAQHRVKVWHNLSTYKVHKLVEFYHNCLKNKLILRR